MLRGFGVVLPPLLTIVVLIWAWTTIESYVLRPVENLVRSGIVWAIQDSPSEVPAEATSIGERRMDGFTFDGMRYVPDPTGRKFIPEHVKKIVDENADEFEPNTPAPASAIPARWDPRVPVRGNARGAWMLDGPDPGSTPPAGLTS